MIFEALDHGKDDNKEYWGQPHLRSTSKEELITLQKVMMSEEEVMIIPKSVYNMMVKHGNEIVEFLSEKYPEDLMGEDMQKAAEHMKMIISKD